MIIVWILWNFQSVRISLVLKPQLSPLRTMAAIVILIFISLDVLLEQMMVNSGRHRVMILLIFISVNVFLFLKTLVAALELEMERGVLL